MPSVGSPPDTASRISCFTGVIQSRSSSSLALIAPPRTSRPAYPARPGSGSPAYGWRTSRVAPASSSHAPNRCGGSSSSGWITRTLTLLTSLGSFWFVRQQRQEDQPETHQQQQEGHPAAGQHPAHD